MKIPSSLLASVLSLVAVPLLNAAISVSSEGFTYSQDFNSLAQSGTGNAWSNDSTIPGWSLFTGGNSPITAYNAGTGSSNSGSFYSFGSTSATDRALGGVGSGGTYFGSPATGSVAGYIAAAFINSTGSTLNSITISFVGEQWRDGGAATPAAQSIAFQYGFESSFAGVATWSSPGGSFDWSSPIFANTGSGAAVDGNVAGLVAGRGGTLSSLDWANGNTLWFRWIEINDTGNDHGLAIDNFAVTQVVAVPEPASALLGALCLLALLRRRR